MATDQNLDILIQADATGVKAGMNEAKQSVTTGSAQMQQATEKMAQGSRNAIQQMMDTFRQFSAQHSETMRTAANDSSMAAGKMATSLSDAVGGVKGSLGGLGEAVGFVGKHFALLAAVAAGAGIFKEGINETKKFTGEAIGLSKALGISATEAGVLNMALGDVYVTSDEYSEMSRGLTRQLKLNEDAINKMGVVTRDSNGHLRNQYEIMKDAGRTLEEYKEGTDRNLAAQTIFGRGVQDAGTVIRATNVDLDAAREKSEALGLMLSVNNVKDMKAYKAAMNDLDDVMMAIKKAVGDQVMPIFTELSNWLSSIGPAAVVITKGAFGGLAATFWYVRNGVVVLWETINAMVITVAEPIRALGVAIALALGGNFKEAAAEVGNISTNIKNAWSSAMDNMVASSEKTNEKVKNLFIEGDPTKKAASGSKDFVDPKEKKEKKASEPKLMRGFEAELAEMKVQYQEAQRLEGSFREYSKEQELSFWQDKLQTVEKGSEDEKAIRLKTAQLKLNIDKQAFDVELANLKNQMAEYRNNTDAKLGIAEEYAAKVKRAYGEESTQYKDAQRQIIQIKRQAAEQMNQIEAERAKLVESYQLDSIENAREESQMRTQLGMQTKEQELQLERQFEDEIYQIRFKALQDKLQLAEQDPDRNPVEVAKIHAQIEQMELQHRQKLRQIDRQATVEERKEWTGMFSTIQSGMANVIKGVLSGTMSMSKAVKSMFAAVGEAVLQTLANIAAKWIMTKITEMIWGKTAAASGVAANAAVAATAAMASVAAIPFVGWAMAPGVGAQTYATAMAYEASIASARGGFDIPAGVNPITQLHEKEMVLPSKEADTIRNLGDGAGNPSANITINAMNSKDVKRLFLNEGGSLVASLQKQARNFRGVGK